MSWQESIGWEKRIMIKTWYLTLNGKKVSEGFLNPKLKNAKTYITKIYFGSSHKYNHNTIYSMYSIQNKEPDYCVCKLNTSFF